MPCCDRDVYERLCARPDPGKRHILVSDDDGPLALLSLRRRPRFWEPVAHQCLPGFIAPARDQAGLARSLRAAGLEIRVESGLEEPPHRLDPTDTYSYAVRQIDLEGDYTAYWHAKGRRKSLRASRKRCAELTTAVDDLAGIAWTVEQWSAQWRGHPSGEIAAAGDRAAVWSSLYGTSDAQSWRATAVTLADGRRRVAGAILLARDDTVTFQCTARDPHYERLMVGSRVLELAVEWAADAGYRVFDLGGGGGYKRWWGPESAHRHAASFRPVPHRLLATSLRSAKATASNLRHALPSRSTTRRS